MFKAMSGQIDGRLSSHASWDAALPWLMLVFVFNFYLIYRGLSGGIEKMCNYGMPLLIVLALVVLARVMTLGAPDPAKPHDNVVNGLGYMWNPSKVQIERAQPAAEKKSRWRSWWAQAAIAAASKRWRPAAAL
jgi:SNF family Na+-dependent transporter